jgi:hypothetical protein
MIAFYESCVQRCDRVDQETGFLPKYFGGMQKLLEKPGFWEKCDRAVFSQLPMDSRGFCCRLRFIRILVIKALNVNPPNTVVGSGTG